MSIIQMSMAAAILILAVVIIRSLAIHKLPKKTFLVLWCVVLVRLLIPFYVPLPPGAYSLTDIPNVLIMPDIPGVEYGYNHVPTIPQKVNAQSFLQALPITAIWLVGMIGLASFFLVAHLRGRKEYKAALPIQNNFVNGWLQEQKLIRSVQVRYSDRIYAPMTFGIFKPVILFPKNTDWQDEASLRYVLTHELTHIKRFDVLTKWLLAAALCVHWFNPLVWVMYILANRDIEVACDETVVWNFGEKAKSAYAMVLMGLEERKSGFSPLCNNFAKNAIKERIDVIMRIKRNSIMSMVLAFVLIASMTVGVIVVSAQTNDVAAASPIIQIDNGSNETATGQTENPHIRPPVININDPDLTKIEEMPTNPAEVRMDYYTFRAWVEAQIELDRANPDIDSDLAAFLAEYYNNALELLRQSGTHVYVHHNGSFYIIRLGWEHVVAEWNISNPAPHIDETGAFVTPQQVQSQRWENVVAEWDVSNPAPHIDETGRLITP